MRRARSHYDNRENETLLMNAASFETIDVVNFLLRMQEYVDVNAKDNKGNTALHHAMNNTNKIQRLKIVSSLIESEVSVDEKNISGQTALMQIVQHGTVEDVSLLIKNGANINFKNNHSQSSLLHLAIHNCNDEECLKITTLLLEKGANIDEQCEKGFTSLMLAVLYRKPNIVKILVKYKANLDIQNVYFKTALQLALCNDACPKSESCAQILLEAEANPYVLDKEDYSSSQLPKSFSDLLKYLDKDIITQQ